jgi:hypothetical protein
MEEEDLLLDKYNRLIKKLRTLSDSDAAKEILIFFSESFFPVCLSLLHSILQYDFTRGLSIHNVGTISKKKRKEAFKKDQENARLFHDWVADHKDESLSDYLEDLKSIFLGISSIMSKQFLKKLKKLRKEGVTKDKEIILIDCEDKISVVLDAYHSLLDITEICVSEDRFFEKEKMDKFKGSKSYERLDGDRHNVDDIKINVLWKNMITIFSFLAKGSKLEIHEKFFKDLYDEYFQYYDVTLAEISGAGKIDLEIEIKELKTLLTMILDGLLEGNYAKILEGLYTNYMRCNNIEIKNKIVIPLIEEKKRVEKRLKRVVEMKKLLEKKKEKKRKNRMAHVLRGDQLRYLLTAIEKMAMQQQQDLSIYHDATLTQQERRQQTSPILPSVKEQQQQQDFSIYHDATLTQQEYENMLRREQTSPILPSVKEQQQQQQQLTAQSFFREIFRDKYPSLGSAQGAQAQFRGHRKETVYRDNTHRLITALSQNAVWQSLLHNVTINVYFIDMANVLKTCPILEWKDLTFFQRQEFILSQYVQIPALLKRHYLNRFTGEPMKPDKGNELYVLFGQKNMENASDDIVYVDQPNRKFIIILVGCFDRTQNCNCYEDPEIKNEMDDFALLYTASQMVRYRENLLYSIKEKASQLQGAFTALGISHDRRKALRDLTEYAKRKSRQRYHIVSNDQYKRKRLRYTLEETDHVSFYEYPVVVVDMTTTSVTTDEELRTILRENIPKKDIQHIPGRLLQPVAFPCYGIIARLIPDPLIRQQVMEILAVME